MKDYLNKNFISVYRKYLIFPEKPFFRKLESTNNKLENYFGNMLDKYTKRIYGLHNEYLTILWQGKWIG